MYLKYIYFTLTVVQTINIFTGRSLDTCWYKYYNYILFGALLYCTMHS